MEFEQKAEEKKMSMSKNIARLAVTAGLTAALSFGGVMAPVTMAFAEGKPTVATEDGKVFITDPIAEYADTSFKGIQIFTAKITQNKDGNTWSGDKTLSDIQWAPGNVKTLVTTALKDVPGVPNVNEDAQTWAEFISTTQSSNYGETTAVDNGTVLDLIAEALEGDKTLTWTQPSNSSKGNFESLDQGYWLFVTDAPSKTGNTDVYTSPIFTIVGGSDVKVAPKKSVPTVVKKIKNDDGSDWADKADSQMGQKVEYKLTGTVASNIATFDTYHYEFSDELSDGLTADDSSVIVKIGEKILSPNTTPGAKTGYDVSIDKATNTLTVKFADLKTAAKQANAALDGSSNVVVTYTAMLDPMKATNVTVGDTGNDNAVKLIYSNNPMGEGTGESVPDTVRDYTYALKLVKVDSVETAKKLEGVRFTIQATTPDDASSNGKFVQEKGNLGADAYEFTTNKNGEISVAGLDAGTYTVHEVEGSNPGYNTLKDFNFTIEANGLKKLEGERLDDNTDPNTLKVTAGSNNPTMVTPSADGGTITLTVKNEKGSGLPLTGLNGVTFTWIAGGAVLCIGVAHLIRSRKQAEESEQE